MLQVHICHTVLKKWQHYQDLYCTGKDSLEETGAIITVTLKGVTSKFLILKDLSVLSYSQTLQSDKVIDKNPYHRSDKGMRKERKFHSRKGEMAGGKQGGGDADGERREGTEGVSRTITQTTDKFRLPLQNFLNFPVTCQRVPCLKRHTKQGRLTLSPLPLLTSLPSCIFASLPIVPHCLVLRPRILPCPQTLHVLCANNLYCGRNSIVHIIGDDARWMVRRKSSLCFNTFIH